MQTRRNIMKVKPLHALCAGAAFLSGCSGNGAALPATALPAVNATAEYIVGATDSLAVHFTYNAAMDAVVPVQQDGRITLPMIGEVMAAGTTPQLLGARITGLYGPILQRPDVVVSVRDAASQRIYVAGEVGHPGIVTLDPAMSVTGAITAAGGIKDTAGLAHVIIIRHGSDGADHSYWINVADILDGKADTTNARLAPHDIVFVPKSGVAKANMNVKQFIHDNIPIGVGLPL
jgi:protein involved in polysaccharide export with SLBB domain